MEVDVYVHDRLLVVAMSSTCEMGYQSAGDGDESDARRDRYTHAFHDCGNPRTLRAYPYALERDLRAVPVSRT